MLRKNMKIRSQRLRDAAKDQPCTLNIIGACNNNPDTTVLAHLPGEHKGIGTKVCDLNAVHACSKCHAVIDGVVKWPADEQPHADWYMRRALHRTLVNLVWQGELQRLEISL